MSENEAGSIFVNNIFVHSNSSAKVAKIFDREITSMYVRVCAVFCMYVRVYVCMYVCMYVCVCVRRPGGVVVKISNFQPDGWEFYTTRGRKKI